MCICFTSDGKDLACGFEDYSIKIWDVKTNVEKYDLKGHIERVKIVCYSPKSNYLASGSYDRTVKIWNTESGICMHNL